MEVKLMLVSGTKQDVMNCTNLDFNLYNTKRNHFHLNTTSPRVCKYNILHCV